MLYMVQDRLSPFGAVWTRTTVGSSLNMCRTAPGSICRGKVESSAFRIVSDLVILYLLAAIPSTGIVLHRAHPSRLPFGAQPRRGPDGTRSRCGETHSGMREWQPAPGAHAESGTFYFAGTGTFYFAPTASAS